jgi:hypothetical protein
MTEPRNRWTHKADVLTAPELAAKLCIPVDWLYVQIRKGKLLADRQPSGAYLFNDSTAVLDGIQRQRNHLISCLDLRISQPHQEGHQHAPSALRLPAPDICEEGYSSVGRERTSIPDDGFLVGRERQLSVFRHDASKQKPATALAQAQCLLRAGNGHLGSVTSLSGLLSLICTGGLVS